MILKGCEEGKATPKLVEVKCPACGNELEVFVRYVALLRIAFILAPSCPSDA